jgi:ubiquinone/menaquinone biosynthesis C-methylase UbiE
MSKDSYRKTARRYDMLVEPLVSRLRAIGMRMASPQEGMLVLDIGCGTGTQLHLYRKAGCRAFGIDTSAAMLAVARQKLGEDAELRLGDARQMPYPDGTFDLITATLILHEIPAPARPGLLGEARRVLKGDGRILLIDYHPGPVRFPEGWLPKMVITAYEVAAGGEHFRNYRDYLARQGLIPLITSQQLVIDRKKIVSGGNLGLFLLSRGQIGFGRGG